ncbi:MAG TPA: DinB family protein [Candidatus Sulfopaludibacter sp.]|jgi:uncharacterized damage-inducible protein DinB|nr:DinB family protein [Candidatus Sulfopaludibacter sp.]
MDAETLREMAAHQEWADAVHWKALREHDALLSDPEIQTRLNHMVQATRMLTSLARGETVDPATMKTSLPVEQLESSMQQAQSDLAAAVASADLSKMISLPRGPKGPFEVPAGVLLLQALTHSLHHRGQNGSRMRQLGVAPPMTDFIVWYATGRP